MPLEKENPRVPKYDYPYGMEQTKLNRSEVRRLYDLTETQRGDLALTLYLTLADLPSLGRSYPGRVAVFDISKSEYLKLIINSINPVNTADPQQRFTLKHISSQLDQLPRVPSEDDQTLALSLLARSLPEDVKTPDFQLKMLSNVTNIFGSEFYYSDSNMNFPNENLPEMSVKFNELKLLTQMEILTGQADMSPSMCTTSSAMSDEVERNLFSWFYREFPSTLLNYPMRAAALNYRMKLKFNIEFHLIQLKSGLLPMVFVDLEFQLLIGLDFRMLTFFTSFRWTELNKT